MAEQKYKYQEAKIADLLLNPNNPRFNPVKYQTETILSMIDDQGDKLVVLAEHIINHGLNPTDVILVCPYEKQLLVLEGNRRVTALKLVNEPDLIPDELSKLKKEFQRLNSIVDNSLLDSITCVVANDAEQGEEWIRLKHTGENEGAGTVRWDGQQTSRFNSQTSGIVDARIVFLDELRSLREIPEEYKERFHLIKKTNFDRLTKDPDVRELLGIDVIDNKLVLINGVNSYLLEVLYDLIFADLSVGKIYSKEDRKNYLLKIVERVEVKGDSSRTDSSESKQSDDAEDSSSSHAGGKSGAEGTRSKSDESEHGTGGDSAAEGMGTATKGKGYPINRKALVPQQHRLTITHARIAKIFNELKTLDTEVYPNAVSVLLRVFIELSADCYITTHAISDANVDSKLSRKIEAVANDLEVKKILTKHELRAARQMASGNMENSSVKTFHSYVHNKDLTPSATDLKAAWDDLWLFIEGMWR